jgi:uncharacterized protein YecE (DUF72 family)
MTILLGVSGWSYDEWVGSFYEEKDKMFTQYTKVFRTAEINSTFYRFPNEGLVYGLGANSPPEFVFSAKLPREITHKKRLRLCEGVRDDLERFLDIMQPLAEKLGAILIQLPPSFTYSDDGEAFFEFLEILPQTYEFAVEFRDLSWLKDGVFNSLRDKNVAYTLVDEPVLPPEVHVTADFSYIRWHGHGSPTWYNYDYSREELKEWVPKVREVEEKTRHIYAYFNNHFTWTYHGDEKWGYPGSVKNAIEMRELLGMEVKEEQEEALKQISEYIKKGKKGEEK